MPTLQWIGKDKVISHHLNVPVRELKHKYGFSGKEETINAIGSGNKIVHGDNLEALKALLPEYEGRIKCIYIDPPYNTGNENWVYNDNVNDPKIKKWLNTVVGKEGEDLSRHDKWLCMMYPRLSLLHKLLDPTSGLIFISIDDNEAVFLKLLMDEIFGEKNFIQQIIWKNKYGPGAMTKGFGNVHEYIFCYSKSPITSIEANLSKEEIEKYKNKDSHYKTRGGYVTQPLATKSKDDRPNLVFPIMHKGIAIMPDKQWIWSRERVQEAYEKNWLQITEKDGKYSVRFKQYLKDENSNIRKGKPISILNGPFNQEGTENITQIFESKIFNNPKPASLIEYLLSMIVNGNENRDGIYLDSFAGSGTTAHAVLNLNKADGGNRKFILIEMEDYANSITAERVKRVINGYSDKEGTGGSFDYFELGENIFTENGYLNEEAALASIRNYIYYTETRSSLDSIRQNTNDYFLGVHDHTAYYLMYEKGIISTLNHSFISSINIKAESYVVYADNCVLTKNFMLKHGITFKKIPRDIIQF